MYFQRDVSAFKFNASNFSHRSNKSGFADCNFQPAMGTEPPGTGMLAHPIGLGGKPFPKKIRPLGKNGMAGGFFRSARPKASQTALAGGPHRLDRNRGDLRESPAVFPVSLPVLRGRQPASIDPILQKSIH